MDLTKEILQKLNEYESFNPNSETTNYIPKDYWLDLAKDLNALFALRSVSQQRELLLAWEKSQYIEAGWNKSKDMVADKIDKYLANNCG
jgi:hypothetical protein